MTKTLYTSAFILGLLAVFWVAFIFIGADALALTITVLIAAVYGVGFVELQSFRQSTATLKSAIETLPETVSVLEEWLAKLPPSLRNPVQQRIEGERAGLPAPILTPYLVGLLVMLGLLGTFVGMVETLKGAVLALEGSTELVAIRAGLAAPIGGLGLAFGTSVAGVSASAMLGLMSTLSRRDRVLQTRILDSKISTVFKKFSLVYNRQQTYKALQEQAQSLPVVAESLSQMAQKLELMGNNLGENLTNSQQEFHQTATAIYTDLAASVDKSLRESAADSGRQTGQAIKPIIEQAMAEISSEVRSGTSQTHEQLLSTAQQQLTGMAAQLESSFDKVSADLMAGQQAGDQQRLALWSDVFGQAQQQAAEQLVDASKLFSSELKQVGEQQHSAFEQAANNFSALSALLSEQWNQSGQQTLAVQQEIVETLQLSASDIGETARSTSTELMTDISRLIKTAEQLVESRVESERHWLEGHSERMTELTSAIQTELSGLTAEEQRRSNESIERLAGLESTVTSHLARLGNELEQPMSRLIEMASETPRAAAEVISQLKREIANNIERDNSLLEERRRVMEQLNLLSTSMEQSAASQHQAMESLVSSSAEMLQDVGVKFTEHVSIEATKLTDIATLFAGGATEISSLGESFKFAVQLFNDSNTQLVESLMRIEESLVQSSSRSDEQLGYYVGQAREIIDHSIHSQKQMLEGLRDLSIRQEELFMAEENA